jgi:hypothetical protein
MDAKKKKNAPRIKRIFLFWDLIPKGKRETNEDS